MSTRIANGTTGVDAGMLSAATLFGLVWEELTDVLGTAAVAVLVRRAAAQARLDVVVHFEDLKYGYTLPQAWADPGERGLTALRALAAAMGRLLVELTGTVVLHRLEERPELRACGLSWRPVETK